MCIQSPYFHILKLKSSPILDTYSYCKLRKEQWKVLFLLSFKWLSNIVSFLSLLSLWTLSAKRIINFLLHYLTDIGKVRISESSFHFSTRDRGSVKQKDDKFMLTSYWSGSWAGDQYLFTQPIRYMLNLTVCHYLKDDQYNILQTPLHALGPRDFQLSP